MLLGQHADKPVLAQATARMARNATLRLKYFILET